MTIVNLLERIIDIKDYVNCNIEYNFYIRSNKEFLVQFTNKADPYFKNHLNKNCNIGIITTSHEYKIYETNLSGETKYNNLFALFSSSKFLKTSNSLISESNYIHYQLGVQEFKSFLFELI